MLYIKNLTTVVSQTKQPILNGLSLSIKKGETHALMGMNGCGKSSLTKVILGHPGHEITSGEISFESSGKLKNLSELLPHERANLGIFLSPQYPVEIPGLSNFTFLMETFNQHCTSQGAATLDPYDFKELVISKLKLLQIPEHFLDRSLNAGFSGGEKKKNEILQLLLLNPNLAMLDEIDSGLDIDALKIVANGIYSFKNKYNSVLLVTHYQRLLDYVKPDFVHIMKNGVIVETGDATLAQILEDKGFDHFSSGMPL